jgi:Holliday junction DNA helicase RuvA
MIAQVQGRLAVRDLDRVEIATAGGVAYEIAIPLTTFETLPPVGEVVTLHTHLVAREDEWSLYGFASAFERRVFRRLLGATGVGPSLALGMLSRFPADRLVRAIRERDVTTLQSVPRVGRKKAQQLVLDLAEKLDDLERDDARATPRPEGPGADDAIRALVSLGYTQPEAEQAVRAALDQLGRTADVSAIIRSSLAAMSKR